MVTGMIWLDIILGVLIFNLTMGFWFSFWRRGLMSPEDYNGLVEHILADQLVKKLHELRRSSR